MSWKVLDNTRDYEKKKREQKRKRRIKRGSKRGRYVVLGSRGRNGRKAALHCVTCGDTIRSNVDGLVCHVCAKKTEGKVEKFMKEMAPKPFKHHSPQMKHPQMEIPEMSK